ncbi:MAG TPA: hypothetical protein P5123_02415 [Spirochaetota bacterium]|nr:hypothetical protein [Spirochaetota bacterium]
MTISEIVEKLIAAKEAYYETSSPIMSDSDFDSLEDELKNLDPQNPYFGIVGTGSQDNKIRHKVPMLSMQKAKTVDEVQKWMEKLAIDNQTGYCIQPKIDGLSASCCYENGRLLYVATRGDGATGQDITHIADHVQDIPENIEFTKNRIEVRGELYLPKDTKYDTQGRPLRNNCVGLINRKESREELHFVRFAAFQIICENLVETESEAIELLSVNGFNTVSTQIALSINQIDEYFSKYLIELRNSWKYETDGLVITVNNRNLFEDIDSRWVVDHHHHYAIALKPPAEAKETKLIRVEWQISRQGNAIPVAVFDPVFIGGARIERASLSNYETVNKMGISSGNRLLIERANDVIPYVRENLDLDESSEPGSDLIISNCPSCQTKLEEQGVHLHCPNKECPETSIQKILFWVRESGIEQIAEATIRSLYNKKIIHNIKDLYNIKEDDLKGVEGFAQKKISSFLTEVSTSKRMSAREFIAKLGIPLVQKKALAKLKIFSMKDFYDFDDPSYIIGQNIISWKKNDTNISLVKDLSEALDIIDENAADTKPKVCMTGKGPLPRKELISEIENMGYEFSETITSDTSILLCENSNGTSSKLQKARKNGIKLINYSDFFVNNMKSN